METYLLISWEWLINLFELGIFYFYIKSILTPKIMRHRKILEITILLIRFCGTTIGNALGVTPLYTIIFNCILNVLFAMVLFREKKIVCFFWGASAMLINIIAELVTYSLLRLFTPMQSNEIYFGEAYRFPSTSLYIILFATFCFIASTIGTKTPLFTLRQKIFVYFTMFIGIVMTHCFMYIIVNIDSNESLLFIAILSNFVFLCFFIFLLIYIYQLALTQQENEELQEKARLLEMEETQYNNLLSTTQSLREIKHDIHHHLSSIHALIKNKETDQLTNYLNEYETHFNLDYSVASTGNIVVDSILATKLYIAKQQNTKIDFTILLPDAIPFSDVALSALLGNLFDNALEACRKLPEEQTRFIHFQMKSLENMLLIHIDNSFDGIVKKTTRHVFLSRKEEPDHGIGLKRVSTLVEEVDGFIEIQYNEHVFTTHIMVPLEERHES